MAEHKSSETSLPDMDMASHERTFHGFVEISKIGAVHCANALVLLALVYKGMTVTSVIYLIVMFITAVIGLMMKSNGWVPGAVMTVLGLLAIAVG
ncbi:MAG: aa3-type cytochrome c oxidase subunit IV [Rhodobiaceae bacterium]|nr:aa3-type cytochrome c oxidase subunit IV [Rhodobiaceae bacterium]MCC0057226.1 aa3-type cytochrome c oxidase subunit IV [Rhodobiaceae bacterium]